LAKLPAPLPMLTFSHCCCRMWRCTAQLLPLSGDQRVTTHLSQRLRKQTCFAAAAVYTRGRFGTWRRRIVCTAAKQSQHYGTGLRYHQACGGDKSGAAQHHAASPADTLLPPAGHSCSVLCARARLYRCCRSAARRSPPFMKPTAQAQGWGPPVMSTPSPGS
jgi:hypothetical protein